jgi:hypothetical protein
MTAEHPAAAGQGESRTALIEDANAFVFGKMRERHRRRSFRGLSLGKPNLSNPDDDVFDPLHRVAIEVLIRPRETKKKREP